ncbi:hypothetical protein CAEBREN_17501 [Caenorhabditis brenneri]|uniref:Uncharacterized protein n=1 Tax=Caenorhabditis brenneri TaxID=135651 RepID=G0N572_CAEBE|nr:hypothetical protein CAEBREN_17501 [Caenorhabditis brenneri]
MRIGDGKFSVSLFEADILKKRTSGETTLIQFVTYAGSELILGEVILSVFWELFHIIFVQVVADDLMLVSVSQISATLRHPLGKIISDRDIEAESSTKWWFLLTIIFVGLILIGLGWCCLFCFYNVCGYVFWTDQGDYMTKAQRARMKKASDKKPLPIYMEEAAEQPSDTLPSDGTDPSVAVRKVKLNKKTQRSTHTPSEIHFERRLQNERDSIRKAIEEAFYKADKERQKTGVLPLSSSFGAVDTENTDVETAQHATKSEKKRRHTKIGPITAVTTTTTTTKEQEGKTSEISGVSSVTTTSTDELDGFDVSNLPETTLKISKKKKGESDPEVKSEPESDYGSSLEDEKSKDDVEIAKEIHEEVRARPMTAKKQRTSLFGGTGISVIPAQPRAWTVYHAGDRVAEFWNNSRIHSHPAPASPTENGIIQVHSNSFFKY